MHTLASGSPLPGFLNSLTGPLNHYGLLAVLFFVLIEDFGIPVPGETILIAASIYAGSGRLNVVAVGVIGFVAAVTGDNTIIQALTSHISHLKKQHRDQTQALHAALEQAHGENLQLRRELTRLGWTGQPATT